VIPTYLVPVHVTHKMTSEERDEGTRWRKLLGTEWQPGMLVFDTKEHKFYRLLDTGEQPRHKVGARFGDLVEWHHTGSTEHWIPVVADVATQGALVAFCRETTDEPTLHARASSRGWSTFYFVDGRLSCVTPHNDPTEQGAYFRAVTKYIAHGSFEASEGLRN
jgi:hypothetical protein